MSKKNKTISVKVSEREFELLNLKIEDSDLTKSEYLRQSIIANQVIALDKDFKKKQLFLLSNFTNNVNQIAKRCNSLKRTDRQTLSTLEELLSFVKEVVENGSKN